MDWTMQGAAVVSNIELTTGQRGKVVLVGARENPMGAVIVLAGASGGAVDSKPVEAHLDRLSPTVVAEVICMQERLFGAASLPKVHLP
jgi:hypothetical protein